MFVGSVRQLNLDSYGHMTPVNLWLQEIEILKSLSFDRSIVQFYGTCPWQGKTMLVLEHMEVCFDVLVKLTVPVAGL